jgi:hypothetical protein
MSRENQTRQEREGARRASAMLIPVLVVFGGAALSAQGASWLTCMPHHLLERFMDREQELKKLINVLHRTARTAVRVQWMGAGEAEARFAAGQYNKVLARLTELDPSIKGVFEPLPEDSPLTVVAMACRQVVSYYEDEVRTERGGWGFDAGVAAGPFWAFCGQKGMDFEELGNAIRDWVQEWQRHERERRAERKSCG